MNTNIIENNKKIQRRNTKNFQLASSSSIVWSQDSYAGRPALKPEKIHARGFSTFAVATVYYGMHHANFNSIFFSEQLNSMWKTQEIIIFPWLFIAYLGVMCTFVFHRQLDLYGTSCNKTDPFDEFYEHCLVLRGHPFMTSTRRG